MKWNEIRSHWPELAPSLLARWPQCDETDVLALDGDYSATVAYLSRTAQMPRVAVEDQLAEWADTAMPADARMHPAAANEAITESAAFIPENEEPLDADESFGDETSGVPNQPSSPIGRTER